MQIICPEHHGIIYVPGDFPPGSSNSLVIECPVCNEQVLINRLSCIDDEMHLENNQQKETH